MQTQNMRQVVAGAVQKTSRRTSDNPTDQKIGLPHQPVFLAAPAAVSDTKGDTDVSGFTTGTIQVHLSLHQKINFSPSCNILAGQALFTSPFPRLFWFPLQG
jgi:hypothetical protein